MSAMTPEQARAYLERWELVRKAEVAQLQRASSAVKFRQMAALFESRGLFREDPQRHKEIEVVRERWALLRMALGVR